MNITELENLAPGIGVRYRFVFYLMDEYLNQVKASWKHSWLPRLETPLADTLQLQLFLILCDQSQPTSRFAQVFLGAQKASLTWLFVSCAELVSSPESIWPLTLSLCMQVRISKFAMK